MLYVFYRLAVATFFGSSTVYSVMYFDSYSHWIIYLTHWSYSVITINTILQAVCVTRHYINGNKQATDKAHLQMSPVFKVIWVLQNITFTSAPLVSAIYWPAVYRGTALDLINISTHIVNSGYVVVDVFITAIPVRILHFLHVVAFATVYILFTVIYWASGGTNVYGEPFVYSILDYGNEPSKAADWLIGVYVALVLIHCGIYALYRLRVLLSGLCGRRDVSVECEDGETVESAPRDTKIEELQMV
ncbi:hypothetical protein NP493_404g02071 [Ridgeia piscesae]|uniref:Uncharacterized protein n=1 Tax=Ridgeia piscesae TaxID=27915 RepID=A0AAD9L0U5_RIDPI|nr:hypothetical protein NP493_404g02071 [Ridgeia piscesae]